MLAEVTGPTTFDFINLGIAVAAVVLALGALAWQAAVFSLSGPRVQVAMKVGLLGPGANLVSWAPGEAKPDIQALTAQGFSHPVVTAEIRNKGRMPVSVERVEAVFSNGITLTGTEPPAGERLPYRLEAHSEFTYVLPGEEVARDARATVAIGGTDQVRLAVRLGAGRRIVTPAGLA